MTKLTFAGLPSASGGWFPMDTVWREVPSWGIIEASSPDTFFPTEVNIYDDLCLVRVAAPQRALKSEGLLREAEPTTQTARAGRHLRAHQILPFDFPDEKIRTRKESDFAKGSL